MENQTALEMIQEVELSQIDLLYVLRKNTDEEKLAGLTQSILQVGLLYPPRLTRQDDRFIPVDGAHRILAYLKLGRKSIPAIIEEKPFCEESYIQKALIANGHRSDFSYVEKAEAIVRLRELTGWDASTTADRMGFTNATVSRLMALLQLPEKIREAIHTGKIPFSSASDLAKVEDEATQAEYASRLASKKLTRDQLSGLVKSQTKPENNSPSSVKRISCKLPSGSSVTISAPSLDCEVVITALEDVLAKAKKARTQGFEITSISKSFVSNPAPKRSTP